MSAATTPAHHRPVAELRDGSRPSFVYTANGRRLVRLTVQGTGGLISDEVWHLEVCDFPRLVNEHDDGWRYVGLIPRETIPMLLDGYLGGAA